MPRRDEDEKFMALAIREASKGVGKTSPNPPVGCVIVKAGKVIARDYHHQAGKAHAEPLALAKAGRAARGATMYVTLEPCNIYGRTPPCTKAIIESGIKRVVIGVADPNPKVNTGGISELNRAGIKTELGILGQKCSEIIKPYAKYITTGLPFVTIKYAQSLDGRIATSTGSSKWISSSESLKFAHRLRTQNDAVLVGGRTANVDDPLLTVRNVKGRNPARIVLTGSGEIDSNLKIFDTTDARTIIFTASNRVFPNNVETFRLEGNGNKIDLKAMLRKIGELGFISLLVEGGASVITSFLKQGLADRLIVVCCPIIIGEGVSAVGNLDSRTIGDAFKLNNVSYMKLGPDIAVIGDLK